MAAIATGFAAALSRACSPLARPDPLSIGLDVDANCAVIDQSGKASQHILAVGPLTCAAFWEIIAIPDIRVQAAPLAAELASKNHKLAGN
jgi:uncharacterized NAD(P)/FAD-binding protein YdhS